MARRNLLTRRSGGIGAVAFGFPLGDPIAGIAIGGHICHVGHEVTGEIVSHLMDAVDPALTDQAQSGAMLVPGVRSVQVRGRWAGRSLRLDARAETRSLHDRWSHSADSQCH